MPHSILELPIPAEIYARAQEIATSSNRTVESVLLDGLALLFGALPDKQTPLDALKHYTDDQLRAIVHQRLAWTQDSRLQQLIELGKQQSLNSAEQEELETLIDLVDHQMLLRSEALVILKRRGYDIEKMLRLVS